MTDTSTIFDQTPCKLGEGPLWHPGRSALFWFDIIGHRLYTRTPGGGQSWDMGEHASAAGWIDRDHLLVASETKLFSFDLQTGASETLAPLEADNPTTRSNDGRADAHGGFWIGTMSKSAVEGAGAIYRYYRGEIRRLFPGITIPNAICFAPDGRRAYFADTRVQKVWKVALDAATGWPVGTPEVFLDLSSQGLSPDGAVVDRHGLFWNAQWGAARVAAYDPEGRQVAEVPFPVPHTTCPAFGGEGLRDLYCTSARQGLSAETLADGAPHGATFLVRDVADGQPEHQVML